MPHRHRRMLRYSALFGSLLLLSQGLVAQASARPVPDNAPAALAPAAETVAVTEPGPAVVPTDFSGDVRDLPQVPSTSMLDFEPEEPEFPIGEGPGSTEPGPQPATVPAGPMPAASQNFAGLNFSDRCPTGTGPRCGSGWPPDTNGDVGPSHYVEAVNQSYAIYDKAGTLLASFSENALFSGSGANPCNGNSRGDPIVVYDPLADRWILSHFAFPSSFGQPIAPYYQCIAASKTGDPVSGGWWLYAIRTDIGGPGAPPVGTLNDYPKFGTWTDCLYFAANGFLNAQAFNGSEFASFNRGDLYSGATLRWGIGFLPWPGPAPAFTMIPGNIGGSAARNTPPPGTRDFFVSESVTGYGYEVRQFTPAADCGGGGTRGAATMVSQTPYVSPPARVAQPGTLRTLDSLGERLMQKVQYRKVGSTESLWATLTVGTPSASTASPQWVQIDVTGGVVATAPVQEGIHAPDTTLNRWMGSIAADGDGNAALGYSTASGMAPDYPSIAYAGRLASDPLGTLPRTEVQLVAGQGSQTNTCGSGACYRWGDYTAMSVDPVDDCTFWYTNQYYDSQANGTIGNWQTRIGSFRFPTCASAAPATEVQVETAPDGSGTVVPAQGVAAGSSITVYAVSRDASGGFVANVPAFWSLVERTGGVVRSDLVGSATRTTGTSAVFTGHLAGTATIRAVSGDLTAGDSGLITVTEPSATQVRVETAADGSGSVVPARSLAPGDEIAVYAISRDASGTLIANVTATWSLIGTTGGVVRSDLVGSDTRTTGTSAVFTGHFAGTATIRAESGTLAPTDSGLITVTDFPYPSPPQSPRSGPTRNPVPAAQITLTAAPAPIDLGASTTVTLRFATLGADRQVEIQSRDAVTGVFSTLATVTTDSAGRAVYPTGSLTYTTTFRAVFAGAPDLSPGTSDTAVVGVRRSVTMSPSYTGYRTVARGTALTYGTRVGPLNGIAVPRGTFQVYRLIDSEWVFQTSATFGTDSAGTASFSWTWSHPGDWYVRWRANSDAFNTAAYSPIAKVTVP